MRIFLTMDSFVDSQGETRFCWIRAWLTKPRRLATWAATNWLSDEPAGLLQEIPPTVCKALLGVSQRPTTKCSR